MNILEVVEACNAGVGRHVRGLSEGLIARGHQVTVAYAPHRVDESFRGFVTAHQNSIRFVSLSARREVSPVSDLQSVFQLLRVIKRKGPFDVVHGHSSKGGAIARIAGRRFGIPTVYTPNSLITSSPEISKPKSAFYTSIEYVLGRSATSRLIAVSGDEREFVLKHKLVPSNRVAVIENAIDDVDFEGFAEEGDYEGMSRKPLTFGSTMRFSAQKAPGHLIEAFVRVNEMLPQLPMRLVMAGDGELFAEVKRQVEASGLDEKVSLLGWRTDIGMVLRELDVFVISSLYESGLSYSTMEAMAARLPIISTSVFGTKGTLPQVPGNVLVPVGDPATLAEGMKRMATLTEPGSLRRALRKIGQENRDYVQAHFMQSDITHRTIELYQELCQRSR
jgi:glycosyltransferase involved in cell wall biosynthesis